MKRRALEFVVDVGIRSLVEERIRGAAGEALLRLTIAPVDGTPRYKITALVGDSVAAVVMRTVMNALDENR